MSEMIEAACMIKSATENSLIIIDELGRGTATNEGFGLAWAISEYLIKNVKAFCLFATHFHEMTNLEGEIGGVKNYYVECFAVDNKLNMQYKVKEGFA
jgi:DNA mismatch repair protein MSH2